MHHLTLDQYFDEKKNSNIPGKKTIIPHYVGGRSHPVYPPTEGYAHATLLIHKPWHKDSMPFHTKTDLVDQFMNFLKSPDCPKSVSIPFEHMHWHYLEKLGACKAIAADTEESEPSNVDKDIIKILQIAASFNAPNKEDMLSQYSLNRGLDYEWDKPPLKVNANFDNTANFCICYVLHQFMHFWAYQPIFAFTCSIAFSHCQW